MKEAGYTLVGAEQTANSVCLTNYSFPAKTVLVLGNEKEGIPVDIIQVLDVCVEIPQQGLVRSLNVHVSGALLVWEYTRQHLLKAKDWIVWKWTSHLVTQCVKVDTALLVCDYTKQHLQNTKEWID